MNLNFSVFVPEPIRSLLSMEGTSGTLSQNVKNCYCVHIISAFIQKFGRGKANILSVQKLLVAGLFTCKKKIIITTQFLEFPGIYSLISESPSA